MTKIEVTDDDLIRAAFILGTSVTELAEALNPPPEPEIVVTEDMRVAGIAAWNCNCSPLTPTGEALLPKVYRAMRRLEPYDPLAKQGQMQFLRKNDGGGSGSGNCDR